MFNYHYLVLSQTEIDKYIRISISDFIPTNLNDYSIEFDELGILKQVKKKVILYEFCDQIIIIQNSISTIHPKKLIFTIYTIIF